MISSVASYITVGAFRSPHGTISGQWTATTSYLFASLISSACHTYRCTFIFLSTSYRASKHKLKFLHYNLISFLCVRFWTSFIVIHYRMLFKTWQYHAVVIFNFINNKRATGGTIVLFITCTPAIRFLHKLLDTKNTRLDYLRLSMFLENGNVRICNLFLNKIVDITRRKLTASRKVHGTLHNNVTFENVSYITNAVTFNHIFW